MTTGVRQLGYIGLYSTDLERWARFGDHLGAQVNRIDGETLGLRLDNDRDSRLVIHSSDSDGLAYGGWEVEGPAALAAIRAKLADRGVESTLDAALAVSRGVEEILTFVDPDGNVCEVYWGASTAIRTQFISPRGVEFSMGQMGAGHLTFAVNDFRATHDLYTEVLGMKLSEIADVGGGRVGFLRCNPRHHSIAFAQLPSRHSRLLHLSVEVEELDALGSIRDRLLNDSFDIVRDLGRHPTDGVISLYVGVAPGYEVELGWGSILIDDATWEADRYTRSGWSWGHREVTSAGETTSLGETETQR